MGPPLKAKFFTNNTSVYMSKGDTFNLVRMLLEDWCTVSGAKFNISKTEVILIGSEEHRKWVVQTQKINQYDTERLNEQIKIAEDRNAIRFLEAWIGNQTNNATPWEPVVDRISNHLGRWATLYPTMGGRKLVIQLVVGVFHPVLDNGTRDANEYQGCPNKNHQTVHMGGQFIALTCP